VTGLDPEKPVTAYFLDTKNQLARIVTFSGRDFDRPTTVQLQHCGAARARFVDAQGQPFANVRFSVTNRPLILLEMVFPDGAPGARGVRPDVETEKTLVVNLDFDRYDALTSDSQGRVTYPTLIPGATYRILAGDGELATKQEFVAEPGRALDFGDIRVNPGP
jgi:hypothetical protein